MIAIIPNHSRRIFYWDTKDYSIRKRKNYPNPFNKILFIDAPTNSDSYLTIFYNFNIMLIASRTHKIKGNNLFIVDNEDYQIKNSDYISVHFRSAIRPNGREVVQINQNGNGEIEIWSFSTTTLLKEKEIKSYQGFISFMNFSSDGRYLSTESIRGGFNIRDADNNYQIIENGTLRKEPYNYYLIFSNNTWESLSGKIISDKLPGIKLPTNYPLYPMLNLSNQVRKVIFIPNRNKSIRFFFQQHSCLVF